MQRQRSDEMMAHGEGRVERGERILEHHLDRAAVRLVFARGEGLRHAPAAKCDFTG
jgi:hypothetical protein